MEQAGEGKARKHTSVVESGPPKLEMAIIDPFNCACSIFFLATTLQVCVSFRTHRCAEVFWIMIGVLLCIRLKNWPNYDL